jgi:membrane-associated phospholipid phosphatase
VSAAIGQRLDGDRHDFRVVNDFARDTSWLHGFMTFMAKDGIVLLALALVVGWWLGRRASSPRLVCVAVWGALSALVALLLVKPIASAADEQRPFVAMPHVLKLISHAADTGFPSDHATAAGAVAAALFFVSWRLGLVTAIVALLIAFSRVYVGVHFPQDVAAGLALGAVVAVLGVFVVVPLLTRLATALLRTPLRPLIVTGGTPGSHR